MKVGVNVSKSLILAEKPSVARDIARVLKCNKKGNGFIEGNNYIVTWALGHLVTLADPDKYEDKYKNWKIEDLPIVPNDFELVVIKQTSKQYNTVKQQMYRKDVRDIVIATDAGREGELVARWILDKANVRKPIKRLWISSVTDKAILEGFKNLKDGRVYNNLYQSAVARAEADWVVGINATRALTCKHNSQLSCGRVQTPTLAMIATRDEEIKNHRPKAFYGIRALIGSTKYQWYEKKHNNTNTFNKEYRDEIHSNLINKKAKVTDIKKQQKQSLAPLLYDLTELQRDANKRYSFSAKHTLNIMQSLYEKHKVLTYPRTDSRYISSDIVSTLKERVNACKVASFDKYASIILTKPINGTKHFVNNAKVSDHHAIIPTEVKVKYGYLSDDERKIYDLVVKRFLAVLMPVHKYEQVDVTVDVGAEMFKAKGITVTSNGWKEIYQNDSSYDEEDVEKLDANIRLGDELRINKIELTEGQTKPPAHFTEATLLSAMENPAKYLNTNNKVLASKLNEVGGIGTVATRADIIEKLFKTFLIELKGKAIYITSKGRQLLTLAPADLKSPDLTAKWEQELSDIEKGRKEKNIFISEMKEYANKVVNEIKGSKQEFKHDNITTKKCPECDEFLLEVNSKNGRMLVCKDRKCGYRKKIAQITNARCSVCHKKLTLVGEGDKRKFVCKCGFSEKLEQFEKRKAETGANKRETEKALQRQENAPANLAFADLLKNFKVNKDDK